MGPSQRKVTGVGRGLIPSLSVTWMPRVRSSTLIPAPQHDVLPHYRPPKQPLKPRAKINMCPLKLFVSGVCQSDRKHTLINKGFPGDSGVDSQSCASKLCNTREGPVLCMNPVRAHTRLRVRSTLGLYTLHTS